MVGNARPELGDGDDFEAPALDLAAIVVVAVMMAGCGSFSGSISRLKPAEPVVDAVERHGQHNSTHYDEPNIEKDKTRNQYSSSSQSTNHSLDYHR